MADIIDFQEYKKKQEDKQPPSGLEIHLVIHDNIDLDDFMKTLQEVDLEIHKEEDIPEEIEKMVVELINQIRNGKIETSTLEEAKKILDENKE